MVSRNLYLYGFAILLFIAFAVLRLITFNKMIDYTKSVRNSSEIITALEQLTTHFKSAQIYTPTLQKKIAPEFYDILYSDAIKIDNDLRLLESLLNGHPQVQSQLDTITSLIRRSMPALLQKNIVELIESGEDYRLHDLYRVDTTIHHILHHEQNHLQEQEKDLNFNTKQSNNISIVLVSLGLIIILFSLLSNFLLSRKHTWLHGFLESLLNTSEYGVMAYESVRDHDRKIINFKIVYANPAMEKIVGVKPENLVGKTADQTGTFVSKLLFQKYVEVITSGKKIITEINKADNWYNVVITKLKDGCSVSFHEISQIKQYQRDLESTINKLEKTNAELEQYAYAASHDLQEPLRKISTFSTMLWNRKKEVFDEKDKTFFDKIVSSASRMTKLIHDLLSFSSLKKEARFARVDLNESLAAVLEDLDLLIVQKNAQIINDKLPVIEAIPLQMQQLFYNLLNNALKFSRKDLSPEISIRVMKMNENELDTFPALNKGVIYYRIEVSDNGVGFANEYAENIFGLFKQLHPKDIYKGSGIGLSLCQRVAENHSGIIYARGEENAG
ncbi:MAG TPA: ATP-binding protein, partial [Flavitalea sp.]|nr:ATP-binding protein [Flavitalea sp.]